MKNSKNGIDLKKIVAIILFFYVVSIAIVLFIVNRLNYDDFDTIVVLNFLALLIALTSPIIVVSISNKVESLNYLKKEYLEMHYELSKEFHKSNPFDRYIDYEEAFLMVQHGSFSFDPRIHKVLISLDDDEIRNRVILLEKSIRKYSNRIRAAFISARKSGFEDADYILTDKYLDIFTVINEVNGETELTREMILEKIGSNADYIDQLIEIVSEYKKIIVELNGIYDCIKLKFKVNYLF
ncbi:hypothetical protein [Liberiplasma polymorphum]|uniref:hypothetical protein n=1 Tax=Liberiplasma polymorphum TaxID=3374570 RepID=UPI0037760383